MGLLQLALVLVFGPGVWGQLRAEQTGGEVKFVDDAWNPQQALSDWIKAKPPAGAGPSASTHEKLFEDVLASADSSTGFMSYDAGNGKVERVVLDGELGYGSGETMLAAATEHEARAPVYPPRGLHEPSPMTLVAEEEEDDEDEDDAVLGEGDPWRKVTLKEIEVSLHTFSKLATRVSGHGVPNFPIQIVLLGTCVLRATRASARWRLGIVQTHTKSISQSSIDRLVPGCRWQHCTRNTD
jgi:hypothetical protein